MPTPNMAPDMEEARAGLREGVSLCLVKSGKKQGREERGGKKGREGPRFTFRLRRELMSKHAAPE